MNNLPVPLKGTSLRNVQDQDSGNAAGGEFVSNGNVPSMGHTTEDARAMGDILSRLRNLEDEGFQKNTLTENHDYHDSINSSAKQSLQSSGDNNIDAMKDILLKLQNVGNETTKELINESTRNPVVKEALTTRRTKSGVSVGQYEIRIRVDESRKRSMNYFDVIQSGPGVVIAKDLILYEAALILTKLLNRGEIINGSKIRSLLRLEETYYNHRVNAARYKAKSKKYTKNGDYNRAEIFEHRYEDTRAKALQAKQDIVAIGSRM